MLGFGYGNIRVTEVLDDKIKHTIQVAGIFPVDFWEKNETAKNRKPPKFLRYNVLTRVRPDW